MSLVRLTKQQIEDMGLREKVVYHKDITFTEWYNIKNNYIIEFDSELRNYRKEKEDLLNKKQELLNKTIDKLNIIINLLKNEKYNDIEKLMFSSEAGDYMGDCNEVIEFGSKGDKIDLEDIIIKLKDYNKNIEKLKNKQNKIIV